LMTFDEIIAETKVMLKYMPEGWYVLDTSNHGAIGIPINKKYLIQELENRYLIYDKAPNQTVREDNRGLAETIIGYHLITYKQDSAEDWIRAKDTRMEKARRFRAKQKAAKQRKLRKKLRTQS
jgi:hypothetical protein